VTGGLESERPAAEFAGHSLPTDFAAVADFSDQHKQPRVLDASKYPDITDAIAP
jgi:hypothetical protein